MLHTQHYCSLLLLESKTKCLSFLKLNPVKPVCCSYIVSALLKSDPDTGSIFLQDLVMDILRVLTTPDLEVRKKTLQLALDLVSSRNVEEVSDPCAPTLLLAFSRPGMATEEKGEYRAERICLFSSWWLFWRRRWSRPTTSQSTKTLISTGSCWCELSTPAACASLTWQQMSYLWWVPCYCYPWRCWSCVTSHTG